MKKEILLLLWLFFCHLQVSQATHIVGGEMNYTCLGDDRYEITLTIFRDCFYGDPLAWFDNPASIGIFDQQNRLVGQVLVALMGNDTLSPVLRVQCFVAPPSVCVHTTTYRTTVTLPFREGGYQLAYQRCCRNQTIQNIINPLASGATFGVTISETALRACNSSPKFKSWPPIYICANEPFLFTQPAKDGGGDFSVFLLWPPLSGLNQKIPRRHPQSPPPYPPVVWLDPPYGVNNMLNGIPGSEPLRIDPVTGTLRGTPNTIGQFVVGICVEEYRNGELISTIRRDFQYNVGICGKPSASFFTPEVQCGNLNVTFSNQSQDSDNFRWEFGDPRQPNASSTVRSPSFTFADTGTYLVRLIVEPGTACADTSVQRIRLIAPTVVPNFSIEELICSDSLIFAAWDASIDNTANIISWDWTLRPPGTVSDLQNPVFAVRSSGRYELELKVTSDNGCRADTTQYIDFQLLELTIPDTLRVCLGDTIALHPMFNPSYIYFWTPPEGLSDPSAPNPLAAPDSSQIYTVIIKDAEDFCSITHEIVVLVAAPIDSLTAFAEPDSIFGRGTAQLFTTFNNNFTYTWIPANNINNPTIHNPTVSPSETTTFQVLVRNDAGCTQTAFATVFVINLACDDPHIFIPDAFTPNNDGINDVFRVRGNNIDDLYVAIFNRWGQRVFESRTPGEGWDGTFRGVPLPPDVYGYYVELRCFDGRIFFRKGNVLLIR
ncbi:MAG TPA: gliding motility-associated C-terminal domain-containing protein [Saprospiraceae bacterium]|nr:gliding motility-associated C-terminal domain-containing protein [Saprospiraceae bacterium]